MTASIIFTFSLSHFMYSRAGLNIINYTFRQFRIRRLNRKQMINYEAQQSIASKDPIIVFADAKFILTFYNLGGVSELNEKKQ